MKTNITSGADTICALSTPPGIGALGVIRISGEHTFDILGMIFSKKNITSYPTHTLHVGQIFDNDILIDEVVVSIFKKPHSFTKEDVAEISCHGSVYVINKIIKLLLKQGARYAAAGEFTQRAFINGRFDLAQAEAVADLIASDSEASHMAAMYQMRGGFSNEIKQLREKLLNFASLIELELDFAEEDVEFANRAELKQLVHDIIHIIEPLISSFDMGNAMKNGVPVVIAGKPNAGKSTLLNTLLHEDKAIVSDIPGTTRDVIEDEIAIEGIKFRFIDTAGLRHTNDNLEAMGIARTRQKMKEASLILYIFDSVHTTITQLMQAIDELKSLANPYLLIGNKEDELGENERNYLDEYLKNNNTLYTFVSAKNKTGIENLKKLLLEIIRNDTFKTGNTIVTNLRHYESLVKTKEALNGVINGLENGMTGDFLALDIRMSLIHLGNITGEVTNDEILGNIFSKFCIGK
ncbi:MAG: tRNA uridine-5-carboxymethylaminomethyl(34) synthesis GTPase MnmE [Cytophagales bacterium]|nr:tRNA uridine-5-carboxymethylaminomethyl(34) synthesis GTPase MnmE [Cytophagales bacterium]